MKRILLAVAALLALTAVAQAEVVNRIAAVVNDEIITTYQIDQALESRTSAAGRLDELSEEQRHALSLDALGKLIEEALVQQRVTELGLTVSDDEIDAAIDDVQRQNNLTRSQLKEALEAQGMPFTVYRDNLAKQIQHFKLLGREVKSKVEVTNQELREYFREHIDDYREEPYLRLSRISFLLGAKAGAAKTELVRTKAEEALVRLRAGEDFYTVLLAYSADKSAEGGDLGTFAEGELTPSFDRAVRDLNEGEISELIATPEGFHILKVEEKSAGKIRQFDTVKDEITKAIKDKKTEEGFKAWAAGLKENAHIDIRLK